MQPAAPANLLRMSNIEHSCSRKTLHYLTMKTKELTAKQILSVPCVLRVARQQEMRVNCIRVPCGPSRTETENFPQPRPWRPSSK